MNTALGDTGDQDKGTSLPCRRALQRQERWRDEEIKKQGKLLNLKKKKENPIPQTYNLRTEIALKKILTQDCLPRHLTHLLAGSQTKENRTLQGGREAKVQWVPMRPCS